MKTSELVEQRLREAQAKKQFQDIGRKSGTRKESIAYNIINAQNLTELEDDPALAGKLVVKNRVWPMVDIAREKEMGASAGAAFLKFQYHRALAAKPFNSSEARIIYVKLVEFFKNALDEAKTVKEVEDLAYQLMSSGRISEIVPELDTWAQSTGKAAFMISNITKKKLEGIVGKAFLNLTRYRADSTAAQDKVQQAYVYERFSPEQEQVKKLEAAERNSANLVRFKELRAGILAATDSKSLFNALYKTYSVSNNDMKPFLEAQNRWLTIVDYRIKTYEGEPKLAARYLAREDDWSWSEIKETRTQEKSTKPRINSYRYLSHLSRKGGLEVMPLDNAKIKEKYQLKAIQYGNALNDIESAKLTYWLNGGLSDLQELINVDIGQLHKAGGLGIDFATRGIAGSAATFWPSYSVINLNKRSGDGSLAHEWGHFVDHLIATNVNASEYEKINGQFGRMATRNGAKSQVIQSRLNAIMDFIKNGSGNEVITLTINAKKSNLKMYKGRGTVQETIDQYKRYYPKSFNSANFEESVAHILHKHGVESIEYTHRLNCSWQYYNSAKVSSKPGYWTNSAELFARAFEGYILDLMDKRGFVSDFLQESREYMKALYDVYPYPDKTDMFYLKPLFDAFWEDMRTVYDARLAPAPLNAKRVDITEVNTTLKGAKDLSESAVEQNEKAEKQIEKETSDKPKDKPTKGDKVKAVFGKGQKPVEFDFEDIQVLNNGTIVVDWFGQKHLDRSQYEIIEGGKTEPDQERLKILQLKAKALKLKYKYQ